MLLGTPRSFSVIRDDFRIGNWRFVNRANHSTWFILIYFLLFLVSTWGDDLALRTCNLVLCGFFGFAWRFRGIIPLVALTSCLQAVRRIQGSTITYMFMVAGEEAWNLIDRSCLGSIRACRKNIINTNRIIASSILSLAYVPCAHVADSSLQQLRDTHVKREEGRTF